MVNTREWLDEVANGALSSRITLQATYDAAAAAIRNGTPGDFVECGVWAGANSAAMARAILDERDILERQRRKQPHGGYWPRVHLFDSFQGIPQAGPHDKEYLEAGHAAGLSACSIDTTRQQMDAWGIPDTLLVYHPGWFVDTIPNGTMGKIAVLRLDADLYESTLVCLKELYPRVSAGGTVIIDDWVLSGAREAMREYFGEAGMPGPAYFRKEEL